MAVEKRRAGTLIAVDGTRGRDVAALAEDLAHALAGREIRAGVSRWDASGIFGDLLQAAPADRQVSPRAVLLAFAADLQFRLRWEIQPALAEGTIVIAAPYVDTAMAIGQGLGVPKAWISEVFRFAPAPAAAARARERRPSNGWRPKPERGFGELCAVLLEPDGKPRRRRRARTSAAEWLSSRAHRSAPLLTKRLLGAIASRHS